MAVMKDMIKANDSQIRAFLKKFKSYKMCKTFAETYALTRMNFGYTQYLQGVESSTIRCMDARLSIGSIASRGWYKIDSGSYLGGSNIALAGVCASVANAWRVKNDEPLDDVAEFIIKKINSNAKNVVDDFGTYKGYVGAGNGDVETYLSSVIKSKISEALLYATGNTHIANDGWRVGFNLLECGASDEYNIDNRTNEIITFTSFYLLLVLDTGI